MHAKHASKSSAPHSAAAGQKGRSPSGISAAITYPGSGAGIVTPGFFSKNSFGPIAVSHVRSGSV